MDMSEPYSCLRIIEIEARIAQLTLDMPGRGANILDEILFDELNHCLKELNRRTDLDGLILFSAKPSIFVAGADLNLISNSLDWPDEKIVEFCERGRAVMARLSEAPFVTVAAIHGACVGGGLELALWCDHRIATQDRKTLLGLPEVKLGLIPGWAGTVRLPRMIGFEPAADLMLSGRSIHADQACDLGMVEAVVNQQDLIHRASRLAKQSQGSGAFRKTRVSMLEPVKNLNRETPLESSLDPLLNQLSQKIAKQTDIFPFAPTVLLEHLARTANVSHAEALKSESLAMAKVWGSEANRGLLHHFFLVDHNKKNPGWVDTRLAAGKINTVGVVGAGVMGQAISEICLKRGVSVLLYDAAEGRAAQVAEELRSVATQTNPERSIRTIDHFGELNAAELVIETVVENTEIKRKVLQLIEANIPSKTVIASNTSAIQISQLGEKLQHPDRFCGIHFCHPQLMALVEVVRGKQTSESTTALAVSFVRQLSKMPIAVNDGPGFVVNRLLAAMLNKSIELLMIGYSAERIDQAMRNFGFVGGPFEIIDTIGADTCLYAGRVMWDNGVTCISPSPLIPKLVKLGRLGRKTSVGVYRYLSAQDRGIQDPEFNNIVAQYQSHPFAETESAASDQIIVDQILDAMNAESQKVLRESIVKDQRDIDLCAIYGLGFPQHQGGLTFWGQTRK